MRAKVNKGRRMRKSPFVWKAVNTHLNNPHVKAGYHTGNQEIFVIDDENANITVR